MVSGAPILKELTGARVLHGPNPAETVEYADTAHEGDEFEIGQLKIRVLETPGHTDDHLAFVLHDTAYPDGPVGVFTGDALFVGDVGRTDFYPDRKREVAGLLVAEQLVIDTSISLKNYGLFILPPPVVMEG